ncbi:MAG: hypothetical protein LBH71_00775, partial [Oscillospiraceae bacterium]|nr:hypothetical protein [Oscillospiraceae bacterium]
MSQVQKENTGQNAGPFLGLLYEEVLIKNPVLVSVIGLCPVVAICVSLKSALVLCAVTILTMIFVQVIASAFFKKVPQWLRLALYTFTGMLIVAPLMLLLELVMPNDLVALGIYLPLLAVNPLITRQSERVAVKSSVRDSFINAVCCSLGYCAVLLITGIVREIIGSGSIWGYKFMPAPASAMINPFGGFIIIAFLAALLRGYFKKIDPQYAEELAIHSRTSIKKPYNSDLNEYGREKIILEQSEPEPAGKEEKKRIKLVRQKKRDLPYKSKNKQKSNLELNKDLTEIIYDPQATLQEPEADQKEGTHTDKNEIENKSVQNAKEEKTSALRPKSEEEYMEQAKRYKSIYDEKSREVGSNGAKEEAVEEAVYVAK